MYHVSQNYTSIYYYYQKLRCPRTVIAQNAVLGSACRRNQLWEYFCSQFRGVDSVWGQIWLILIDQISPSELCSMLRVMSSTILTTVSPGSACLCLWFPERRMSPCSIFISQVPVLVSNQQSKRCAMPWGPCIPVGPELLQLITRGTEIRNVR